METSDWLVSRSVTSDWLVSRSVTSDWLVSGSITSDWFILRSQVNSDWLSSSVGLKFRMKGTNYNTGTEH